MTHTNFGADALGDLPVDLRLLAQALIDKIDPVVRLSVAMLADGENPSECKQVWCPVCALAALVSGEQHPMLTMIAEHSVALMAMIRAMVGDLERQGERRRRTAALARRQRHRRSGSAGPGAQRPGWCDPHHARQRGQSG